MARRGRGTLTFQGVESDDHRILEAVTWRDLPLTLRMQTEDFGRHDGAAPVGRIDTIEILADGRVWGTVTFSESEAGQLAAQWVEEQVLRGISVDPGAIEYVEEIIDPATGDVVTMEQIYEVWDQIDAAEILGDEAEQARLMGWLESLYSRIRFTQYEISAATLLATPAFGGATIELIPDGEDGSPPEAAAAVAAPEPGEARTVGERLAALAAGPRPARERLSALIHSEGAEQVAEFSPGRMIASGAATFRPPVESAATRQAAATADRLRVAVMPTASFEPEELDRLTKWTIDRDGRMHGHLFGWEACHRSFTTRCESPSFMRADIEAGARDFHVGDAHLDNGTVLRVGVLTHADLHAPDSNLTGAQLVRLMEDTGQQLGPVRLHADRFGVQACGQLWEDVDATMAARALAGFPSYDARQVAGRWSLYGLHVVNTPGHAHYEEADGRPVRMVASLAPVSARLAAASDCGCGGPADACSCGARLSPQALADLAALDRSMALRRMPIA